MTGRECTFEAVPRDAGPGKQDESESNYINKLYETFGQKKVVVKE